MRQKFFKPKVSNGHLTLFLGLASVTALAWRCLKENEENLHCSRIPGTFAGEITGLDCAKELSDKQVHRIREMLSQHQVLVVRNQSLSESEQINLASKFGEVRHVGHNKAGNKFGIFDSRDKSHFYYNEHGEGRPASSFWHSASTEREPQRYTFLHAKHAPYEGGETDFINMHLAYQGLSADLKKQLVNLEACHSAESVYKYLSDRGFKRLSGTCFEESGVIIRDRVAASPPVFHPLVYRDTEFDVEALFINPLSTDYVNGLAEEDSSRLLEMLYNQSICDDNFYKHKWQAGDLLIWDQFTTIHKGNPVAVDSLRILHKTATYQLLSKESHYGSQKDLETYESHKRNYNW